MEGAFCVCRVHGIVHEASEEGRPFICDILQIKCNPPTISMTGNLWLVRNLGGDTPHVVRDR